MAADFREKMVRQGLADLHFRANFILDLVDRTEGNGEEFEIPAVEAFTVVESGAAGGALQTPVAENVLVKVDKDPAIFVEILKLANLLNLRNPGLWASELSRTGLTNLRNKMDKDYLLDVVTTAIKGTAGGSPNLVNPSGATITRTVLLRAWAKILNQDGAQEQNLFWVFSAFGMAGVMNVPDWQPNDAGPPDGFLGVPRVGTLFGRPVFQTNSVAKKVSSAITASSITSLVMSLTVADSTIYAVGEKVSTIGLTADEADVLISGIPDGTHVEIPTTAGDTGDNGTGTLESQIERNALIDRSFSHAALEAMPDSRIKTQTGKTTDELEISSCWGHKTRPLRVASIGSPFETI